MAAPKKSRKSPRAQVSLVARYRSPTAFEFVQEECFDLSLGGMFIRSPAPAPAGTLIKLECDVNGATGTIRGVARVVWLREHSSDGQPAGMGVKFVKLEPGAREVIAGILEQLGAEIATTATRARPPAPPARRSAAVRAPAVDATEPAYGTPQRRAADERRAHVERPAPSAASRARRVAADAVAAQPVDAKPAPARRAAASGSRRSRTPSAPCQPTRCRAATAASGATKSTHGRAGRQPSPRRRRRAGVRRQHSSREAGSRAEAAASTSAKRRGQRAMPHPRAARGRAADASAAATVPPASRRA